MKDIDVALSQVSDIRAQLMTTTRFLAISPGFNALMALLAFAVATVQSIHAPLQDSAAFVALWAVVFIISSALVAVDSTSRARRMHGCMAGAMLKSAVQKVMPFMAVGIMVTWVICTFALETVWLLPGIWLMLIGLLGFSAVQSLPRAIVWVAYWYLICGVLVFGLAAQTQQLSPWMMGIPMTFGQIAVALVFSRAKKEQ